MYRNKLFGVLLFLFTFIIKCHAQKVVRVYDGDTYLLSTGVHIRMAQIDAPELSQPYGVKAKNFLEAWILNKKVIVKITGTDLYGRTIAETFYRKKWINSLMVESGYAWVYKKYNSSLYVLEQQIKTKKIGLWADSNAISPAFWRKLHPHK